MEKPPPPTPSRQGRGSFYDSLSRAFNKVPFFSRAQLGIAVLLGAVLLLLWAWRANFWLPPSPPPARTLNLFFVEVGGAAAHSGIYSFDHAPTLAEVWRRAGAAPPAPIGDTRLASGSRVEIDEKGGYRLGRMSGDTLMTLGLALDLNTATSEDLDALPGIGPVLAKRIVDYRQAHGPFRKIEDLEQVSGIGPKKLEKIKPYLIITGQEPPAPDQ
jgi:competence ComEA-like helix-hairpin-helix protein